MVDIISKLASSEFMGMIIPVLVIFDTGSTYLFSYKKEKLGLEEKTFLINIKYISKGLDVFVYVVLIILKVVKMDV